MRPTEALPRVALQGAAGDRDPARAVGPRDCGDVPTEQPEAAAAAAPQVQPVSRTTSVARVCPAASAEPSPVDHENARVAPRPSTTPPTHIVRDVDSA